MSNALVIDNIKDLQAQVQLHQHSVIYDYEKGEKLCSMCGVIVQDKIYDAELNTDFYRHKSDTNTVLPHSIILNDKGMSTSIADMM